LGFYTLLHLKPVQLYKFILKNTSPSSMSAGLSIRRAPEEEEE